MPEPTPEQIKNVLRLRVALSPEGVAALYEWHAAALAAEAERAWNEAIEAGVAMLRDAAFPYAADLLDDLKKS